MATKPVTAKLRLRLALIAALPELIMLDRNDAHGRPDFFDLHSCFAR